MCLPLLLPSHIPAACKQLTVLLSPLHSQGCGACDAPCQAQQCLPKHSHMVLWLHNSACTYAGMSKDTEAACISIPSCLVQAPLATGTADVQSGKLAGVQHTQFDAYIDHQPCRQIHVIGQVVLIETVLQSEQSASIKLLIQQEIHQEARAVVIDFSCW